MTATTGAREVVILHGADRGSARPDEADTLVQADFVSRALEASGLRVREMQLGLDFADLAGLSGRPDLVVFNLVESLAGQSSLLHLPAVMLEALRVPFTGARAGSLAITTDKPLSKRLMRGAGLPTPDWWTADVPAAATVIVKPACEDASFGIEAGSVMAGAAATAALAERNARLGESWFAEAFVDGREFNLSLLDSHAGPQPLPPAEIRFDRFPAGRPRILDYEAKWQPESAAYRGSVRHTLAAGEEPALRARLEELGMAAWRLFELRGYARVDFRVDGDGEPWIIEVNANPCLAPDAGFMAAAAAAGLSPAGVMRRILAAV